MRQRGRPRRSSMPAVAHHKLVDFPYGHQQSPPYQQYPQQFQNGNYEDESEGEEHEEEEEEDQRQLSDRYSRIQLVDHWSPIGTHFPGPSAAEATHHASANYPKNGCGSSNELATSGLDMDFFYQQSQQQMFSSGADSHDEGTQHGAAKRKRAFSFSIAPSAATTNTMTTTSTASSNGEWNMAEQSSYNGAVADKRPATKICRVCGDKAYSYNFNVITCESCKAFFRRNANKEKEIRCPFNEQCDINLVSRRFCQRCRLQKCFRVGMKKEWIMSEEARLEKKQRIQENRERRAAVAAGEPQQMEQQQTQQQHNGGSSAVLHQPQNGDFGQGGGDIPTMAQSDAIEFLQHSAAEQLGPPAGALLGAQQQEVINPFTDPFSASNPATTNNGPSPLLSVAAANEQQAIVAQVVAQAQVAAAAQACAVQQAVNQAAAAVLLHHHQQQQQFEAVTQQLNADVSSPMDQQQQQPQSLDPSVVGIPLGNCTSTIHTSMAQTCVEPTQPHFLITQSSTESPPTAMGTSTLLLPAAVAVPQPQTMQSQPISAMISSTAEASPASAAAAAAVLAPAAAVAAAFIQQQQCCASTGNPPGAPPNNPSNSAIANATAVIQQQLASQVVAQAQLNAQMEHHHHQQQQQQMIQHHQQQQAAAVQAVAQLQQQAQAQIVAHAQMVQQQQQQLAALTAAAVQQANTVTQQQGSAETVTQQQLQQVANSLGTVPVTSGGTPGGGTQSLPSFIEVAAAAVAQQQLVAVGQQPVSVPTNQLTSAAPSILPSLIPSAATASMLMQQQASTQQTTMAPNAGISPLSAAALNVQQQHQSPLTTPPAAVVQQLVGHQPQQQNNVAASVQQQEMISVPKDVLMKLVEQKIESEQREQMQTPSKCQCHCQCGRYPNDVLIVDKVMADLLEGSSKQLSSDHTSSSNSTPRLSQQFTPGHFQNGHSQQLQQPFVEAMDTTASSTLVSQPIADQLSATDQEQLVELAKANDAWKNSAPSSSNGELQFLLGSYTEADLRRLIGVAKTVEAFKRLDQPDQERLLKGCFGSFFVLRSLLSVDTSDYSLALLRQNGVPEGTIKFYAEFPKEWRQNETVNLLLGMLLLFNVENAQTAAISVTVENMKFQSLLKRLLFLLCERDSATAEAANADLIARVEQLRQLYPAPSGGAATVCPVGGSVPMSAATSSLLLPPQPNESSTTTTS